MEKINESSFVSTLSIYNSSIITAYTDGRISSLPLPKNWHSLYKERNPYVFDLKTEEKFINEIVGYKGSLFVATTNRLQSFNINKSSHVQQNHYFKKEIVNCTHLKINYENALLFAVSEERGIVVLNLSNPLKPRFVRDITVRFFQEENCIISDMDLYQNTIFLALRNIGILRLDYYQNELQEPVVYRSFEKIRLSDPQDVKYNKNNLYLYIADADEGLIVLNTRDNNVVHRCRLPNNDFPRKIIIHHKNCIVQGSKGLYFYDTTTKGLNIIFEFKIGAISKYYNKIIFYKNKRLNLLILGNDTEIIDNDYFLSVYKYSKNILTKIK
ncbi:hypothetical protein [Bacillus sp. V59.32b]|uniref:hypothetical protein n=1 Tax=Bacillus sp. V59.32b TaxID=1758642 RepID=UPI000E3D7E7C|nr:hypothetical protein [Bacillus sp. V59.32b]RFU70035.1 hypothetical protein D0463_00750 [Bacillus sp. V59.32b]